MRGVEQIPWLYEIICSLYEWSGLAEWRRWLVAGAQGRILDLGSGTGRNLPLLPRGIKAVAVDPSLDALKRARCRAPRVPLVGARAEALPFRDRSFDTVLSGLVFCSVADPSSGLAEVKRVLRTDGELRMLEHVRSRVPWRARLQDAIQPMWTWAAGGGAIPTATPRPPSSVRGSGSSPRGAGRGVPIAASPPASNVTQEGLAYERRPREVVPILDADRTLFPCHLPSPLEPPAALGGSGRPACR